MQKSRRAHLFFLVLLVLCMKLVAQQNSRPVVVHAGRMLNVKTGKLLPDQTIVIENGKIVSVTDAAAAKAPADALRIELPNATILPGLIDAHTHLTFDPKFGYENSAFPSPAKHSSAPKTRGSRSTPDSPLSATWLRMDSPMWLCATPSTPATCPAPECW